MELSNLGELSLQKRRRENVGCMIMCRDEEMKTQCTLQGGVQGKRKSDRERTGVVKW